MSGEVSLQAVAEFLPDLGPFLEDDTVSEIMINGPGRLYVERGGVLRRVDGVAGTLTQPLLESAANQITRPYGFDLRTEPVVDARLSDGSRVAVCAPPASPDFVITVRRFGKRLFTAADLVRMGSVPREVVDAVRDTVTGGGNVLIAGGTGSGKTTLLNACVGLLPPDDRVIVIEDTIEIRVAHSNCVRLEARGFSGDGVTIRDLVRHTLRHRPDHIVIGEVRGAEAADVIQALATGHGGSLTTVHASSCEGALNRIAACAMQARDALPWDVTCHAVAAAFQLVVRKARVDGVRAVRDAMAVLGYDPDARRWLVRPVWREETAVPSATDVAAWKPVLGAPGVFVTDPEPVTVADLLRNLGDTRRATATRRLWRRRASRRRRPREAARR